MKKTVLHQLRVRDGMSYIIEADDGSIIVIDGGMTEYDGDHTVSYLKEITGSDHPAVDAWFITHAHLDHTIACQSAALRHSGEITVKKIIYRFPDRDFIERTEAVVNREIPVFEKALENFKGMEKLTPSTGDRYEFGSTVFEVLFTCADLPPLGVGPGQVINDTSTVLRMTAEGQTVLFLGDAQVAADEVMIERWGKALKSDVCQIAHHGGNGSTSAFYDYVDPEILLWPMHGEMIDSLMLVYEANRHLIGELHVKEAIVAGHGTRALPLPIRPSEKPWLPEVPVDKTHSEPTVKIVRGTPDLSRADDPVWEKAVSYPMFPHDETYPEGMGGENRFLWDDDALYIRVDMRKDFVPSVPDRSRTYQCNNVRLYLCEEAVTAFEVKWDKILAPGFYDKLRFYPETKCIDGREVTTTHPDICENSTFFYDGGYTMMARIAFAKGHKKGDRMSVNLEWSAVNAPQASRAYAFYTVPAPEGRICAMLPESLALAELA